MTGQELKHRIDSMRQTLVGAVPSPAGQIDQITYALIYKFMNDIDDKAAALGGKRTYFVGDFEKYNWHTLMSPSLGAHERLALYKEALEKMSKNNNLPELFREIYQNAFLPFNNATILTMLLKEIDYFEHGYGDDIGDVYEYLLSITGAQGDVGQFRTPRHIIDFIVEAIAPTKTDSVLDPACGTAGFLISAYNYVKRHHDGKDDTTGENDNNEKHLTADERGKLYHNYHGFDIDPTMVRTARVNMYLHGFSTPDIKNHDTLSSDEYWNDKYDVILANPPFMSPKGGIKPHKKFGIEANRAEVLFVDYISSHLKPTGRAGVIVPEGVIFQSGKAYKELRKNLVDNYLYAVVSLPAGVFNPYSGVKTSILLLDKELAKHRDDILFIKIDNDGFNLGAQRQKINGEQFSDSVALLKEYCGKGFIGQSGLDNYLENIASQDAVGKFTKVLSAIIVPRKKIAESGDCNLSGDRYRITTDYTNTKWPMVELKELCEITTGKKDVNEGNPNGEYPFFTCAKENTFINTFSFDTEALLIAGNGDVGAVKYYKGKFDAYQRTYVLSNFKKVSVRYFFQVLNNSLKENMQLQKLGNTMPYIKLEMLQTFQIPLPPLEIQEQIVAELDGYAGIITGAKQITQNWKPKIDIDLEWGKVKLGEVCSIGDGNYSSKYPKASEFIEKGVPFLTATNLKNGTIVPEGIRFISKEQHKTLTKGHVIENDLVIVVRGSSTGNNSIVPAEYEGSNLNSQLAFLRINKKNIDSKYLFFIFNGHSIQDVVLSAISGAAQPQLPNNKLLAIEIPLPPIETQKQIVEKIEAERALVESAKKLIEIYEQKTKEVINKLWEE